jgi:hypothetical protein
MGAVVESMVAAGVDTFIECGSGSALVGMIRRIAPSVRLWRSSPALELLLRLPAAGSRLMFSV